MEKALLKIMYSVPSDPTIARVTITKGCITDDEEPVIEHDVTRETELSKKPSVAGAV